jgi:uncharacterized membrane protein YgdD (TMEM256/DUF423 family)
MTRAWLAAAALGGFLSVGAGAIAAHLTSTDRALQSCCAPARSTAWPMPPR